MKTVIKATAAALCLLAVLCTLAFAQAEKQKIAVYMAGDEPQGAMGSHKMVGGELVNEIIRSRDYSAIDRTEAILAQLAKEHGYQRGGAVSDNQIKALGQQFGVDFLCIVEISAVQGGTFYLGVRLVNVVTAEAVKSATAVSNLRDGNEMMRVAQYLARELVGRGVGQLVQVATQPAVPAQPRGSISESDIELLNQRSGGAAAPTPVPAQGGATIFITTMPPQAQVYIDGRLVGTSNTGQLQVPVGTHRVRLVKDGLEKTESMTFQPGQNPTRFINLR